mgnify:CR=1 FL=1
MSNVHVRQTPMSEMCIVYEIIRHVVLLNRLTLLFLYQFSSTMLKLFYNKPAYVTMTSGNV